MKRLVLAILTIFTMAACQQESSNNGNGQVATPLDFHCINGNANCNNQAYNYYQGWMPYPGFYGYGGQHFINQLNNQGFCNCPSGYIPTYNGTFGLGCVQSAIVNPFIGTFFYWTWNVMGGYGSYMGYVPAAPQTINNYPQVSNISGYPNSASCSNQLTQSCLLNQGNTCGAGASCRPVTHGQNLGVCVRN
ncbi:hypothetical protein BDW_11640 [Bdellovibrio bacteriovorus W]|nr:hypothetical protein BDW_11640 [Bdellovibrio bacteriovorus W]